MGLAAALASMTMIRTAKRQIGLNTHRPLLYRRAGHQSMREDPAESRAALAMSPRAGLCIFASLTVFAGGLDSFVVLLSTNHPHLHLRSLP